MGKLAPRICVVVLCVWRARVCVCSRVRGGAPIVPSKVHLRS